MVDKSLVTVHGDSGQGSEETEQGEPTCDVDTSGDLGQLPGEDGE